MDTAVGKGKGWELKNNNERAFLPSFNPAYCIARRVSLFQGKAGGAKVGFNES